jgi:hypothetical protein
MKNQFNPEELVSELWFSDPSTNLFAAILSPRKSLAPRTLGIYADRLASANQKIRYAADALMRLRRMIGDLSHGEFIYFDDRSRLEAQAALESFLIFTRATLDLVTAAWWAYKTDTTKLDSFHEFLKTVQREGLSWAPLRIDGAITLVGQLIGDFASDSFTWLSAVVGQAKGQSLRDLAVHRSALQLDAGQDERERGRIVLALDKSTECDADAWMVAVYENALRFVWHAVADIEADEAEVR